MTDVVINPHVTLSMGTMSWVYSHQGNFGERHDNSLPAIRHVAARTTSLPLQTDCRQRDHTDYAVVKDTLTSTHKYVDINQTHRCVRKDKACSNA